ncbi:MAG: ATP-binding protein [Mollicutes bacterium]|nr:ATP-binding protein [Mollicutes bacterium]MDD7264551.1 ATP-binding protein [bacterium]MDY4979017.1 ATP-binding protein [Candidatus Onthovivens sp.]
MNKKRIIFQDFIFFIVTLIIFIISITSINYKSKLDSVNNLENYIIIVSNIYNKDEDTISLKSTFDDFKEIRITVLSINDGHIIYDNNDNYNKEENRLDEFINHSNKDAYYKRSKTTNKDVLYLVRKDNDTNSYIRVGIAKSKVLELTFNIALYGSIILITINLGFYIITYYYFKKDILKIEDEVNKLNEIVEPNKIHKNLNINELKDILNKTYLLILEKINEVNNEKNRNEFIIDNVSQGYIILDNYFNIININNYALKLFGINDKANNLLYLKAGNLIENELKDFKENSKSFIINHDNKMYEIEANKIHLDNKIYIALLIIDVSKDNEMVIMKKEFFANASHELKSPLTTIIGYQELIKSKMITKKVDLEKINLATLKEANRMKNIVLDMLDLSKLEYEQNKEIDNINLKDVINDVIKNLETQKASKNIKITAELKDFSLNINKDDAYKLINNLILNAINYNKENGSINIKLDDKLIISDTGIGISELDLPHIFERFYRVDKARSKDNSGTGLGLAIVKHICLNYKFKISVESKIDIGTTFTILFH